MIMKNLRNLLKCLGVAAIVSIAATGCNNRAPFERLNAAVDSTQTYFSELRAEGIPTASVKYDELTNTVVYMIEVDADLSTPETQQKFKAEMPVMEAGIISGLLTDDTYGLGKEIICADASIKLELKGNQGGNLEAIIENSKVLEAYDAVYGEGQAAALRASQND